MILEFLFWLILITIIFTFCGYPLILFLIGSKIKWNKGEVLPEIYPKVSFIIPVFNEEKVIREKITNSLKLDYPDLDIVVISDGSTDNSVKICKEFSDKIRLFYSNDNKGKNESINSVMPFIDSEIVVFTDANTFYDKKAIKNLVRNFSDHSTGCVVGQLKLYQTENSNIGGGEGIYWKYEHMLKKLESRIGCLLVANGGIFGVRKELIEKLEPDIANDFQIPISVASKGYKVVYEPEAIAYEKTSTDPKEEFSRKVRIVNRGLIGLKKLRSKIRGIRLFEFIFHKFLRWMVGPLSIILFIITMLLIDKAFYLVAFIFQIVFYLLALIGFLTKSNVKLLYFPFYICLVNISSIKAIIDALRGKTYSKWISPETSR